MVCRPLLVTEIVMGIPDAVERQIAVSLQLGSSSNTKVGFGRITPPSTVNREKCPKLKCRGETRGYVSSN